jgi:hypothetical protein
VWAMEMEATSSGREGVPADLGEEIRMLEAKSNPMVSRAFLKDRRNMGMGTSRCDWSMETAGLPPNRDAGKRESTCSRKQPVEQLL